MSSQVIVIEDIVKKYENPVAELVREACQFSSTIILADDSHRVNAKSIMGIMAFKPAKGKEICIEVQGDDEEEAADAMANFLLCRN